MAEFDSINSVTKEIKNKLSSNASSKKNILLLYAFNSTGKTRISTTMQRSEEQEKILCFNAFMEDFFTWDNEQFVFKIEKSWVIDFIEEQGDREIINNFKRFVNSKLEPNFNIDKRQVIFKMATGDDNYNENIKISRGEESIFKWSIFYTILTTAINNLNDAPKERDTKEFDDLEYVIIDDPVSSIDDSKIISLAIQIFNIIDSYKGENRLNFIITTHHSLFYNVLYNSFGNKRNNYFQILKKNENSYTLEYQKDSPFRISFSCKKRNRKSYKKE